MPPTQPPNSRLSFWSSVPVIAVGVPALFWLRFRSVNGFAIAFTVFLLMLCFAIEFLPKLGVKFGDDPSTAKVKNGRFDGLGIVWLLAIPFAPFATWIFGELATIDAGNWRMILGIKAFLCVAVPLVCVLPLLRYIQRKTAPYSLLFLFVGTAFPVSIGWASAADLVRGPQWETVEISDVLRVHTTVHQSDVATSILKIRLADGRELEANADRVKLHTGRARILVLEAADQIIAAKDH